jgi:hypothetical protein
VINIIKGYDKGQLAHELSELSLQKYAVNEFCSSHSQVIMALMNLRSYGITENSENETVEYNSSFALSSIAVNGFFDLIQSQ